MNENILKYEVSYSWKQILLNITEENYVIKRKNQI